MTVSHSRLETATNLALIAAACALIVLVAMRVWPRKSAEAVYLKPVVGQSVPLEKASSPRLIAVLRIGCHFCDDSMPFYQQLVRRAAPYSAPVIFVMPEKVNEAALHLQNAGISGVDVRQASLESMHTAATPTLLLIDRDNRIKQFWIGRLDDRQQAEVEQAIAVPASQ